MKKTGLLMVLVALLMASCTNVNTKKTDNNQAPTPLEVFTEAIKDISPQIKKVADVSAMLELSGADYMEGLVNEPQNVNNYKETPYIAAANMGIYLTDVVYQTSYDQSKGAVLSYGAAKDLAFHIGVGEVYDELMLQKIEEGLTQDDSVFFKLNSAIANSENLLNEKEQAYLFKALTIGTNLEKIYILNNLIFNYPVELPADAKLTILRQVIMVLDKQIKQQVALTELIADANAPTEKGKQIINLAKEVSQIYSTVSLGENIPTMKEENIFENQKLVTGFEKVKELRALITQ